MSLSLYVSKYQNLQIKDLSNNRKRLSAEVPVTSIHLLVADIPYPFTFNEG